jgi:hypothetical protein
MRRRYMRTIILSIGLVFMLAFSIGCDSDNNVIAQDEEPGPGSPPSGMTTVSGKVIANNDQCNGTIDGFDIGDDISIEIFPSTVETGPTAKVDNMTKGTSVDCAGNESLFDGPPISGLVCESENTSIPAFTNGNFMSILISYTWENSLRGNLDKSVFILSENIEFVKDIDTQNAPCARVKIDNLTASK